MDAHSLIPLFLWSRKICPMGSINIRESFLIERIKKFEKSQSEPRVTHKRNSCYQQEDSVTEGQLCCSQVQVY